MSEEKGYQAIEIKNKKPEPESILDVELEDIVDDPELTDEELEAQAEEADKLEAKKKAEEEALKAKQEQDKKKERKPSRAEKRIKQLHSEKTDLEVQLEDERKQRIELEKQLKSGSKSSKENMREALQSSLSTLTKALAEAIQDGEAEQAVALQDKMMDTKMQLAGLEAELHHIESTPDPEYTEPVKQKQAPQVPEKALDWIEEHPEFKTDNIFHVSAIAVSSQLINEGFDDDSDEFYEELDQRLSVRFPEVFGITKQTSVKYNQTPSDEELDDKQKTLTQNEESEQDDEIEVEQVVSSSSRTPPGAKGRKPSQGNKIKLSAQDVKQAERWGLTLEQMARRVAHSEKNRNADGYVPIQIKNK